VVLKSVLAGLSLMSVVLLTGPAWAGHVHFSEHFNEHEHGSTFVHAVPELDPSMAAAAIVLVAGGVAIAHGKRRRAAA
jgi:hypothetical protein